MSVAPPHFSERRARLASVCRCVGPISRAGALSLWQAIQRRLDRELPDWRSLIAHLGQVEAVERREAGHSWSDDEVFEALLCAVLSNHTDWAKVERVLPELREVLLGFRLDRYAAADDQRLDVILRGERRWRWASRAVRRNCLGWVSRWPPVSLRRLSRAPNRRHRNGPSLLDVPAASASRAPVACAHCALPVQPGLVEAGAAQQFCCHGCRAVYAAIHGAGLDDYYRIKEELAAAGQRAAPSGRGYAELDHERFQAEAVCRTQAGLAQAELYLEGVHCAACVWLVEKLPRVLPGVVEARLHLGRAVVQLTWDPTAIALSAIARALDRLGYPPHPARGGDEQLRRRAEDRRALGRLGVAGAIAGNVMLMAFALYGGWFHGIEDEYRDLFRWTSLALTVLQLVWPGRVFFTGAVAALRTRTSHMDLPIALGLLAGLAGGAANTITGGGEVYFDSVTVLVFFLLVGRFVQQRQQRAAYDALALLYALTPGRARLLAADGAVAEVPLEALAAGSRVEVRAGDSIPADGVVLAGDSQLDLSLLSGESRPVAVAPGARVHAGTVNLRARLVVEVEATGAETRVGRLMELVERHARERTPIVRMADRLSGWFVLAVLGLAACNLLLWLRLDASRAVEHTVALLIVACPCALGLATPLAVAAAIGRAARRGLLIKGGEVLERLARPGLALLDKTGTVTRGRIGVAVWEGPAEAKGIVLALERHSAHLYAAAFATAFADVTAPAATEVEERHGLGLRGVVGGCEVLVGSARWLAEQGVELPPAAHARAAALAEQALTPVHVAAGGRWLALAGLGDELRPDAAAAIAALCARGWRVGLLSGDHPRVVAAVGDQLGLDPALCRGGVDPEGKVAAVKAAAARGPVLMAGDGVNDAAALAAATIGVAVHGGAEASLAAADVSLTREGVSGLVALIDGAARTVRVIRRNLLVSLAYNAIGVSLAMSGLLNPLVAAILMPASSLTVISLSYRARTFAA